MEKALQSILARLEIIEKDLDVRPPPPFSVKSAEQAVLLEKLERLTIKRHAVLTATCEPLLRVTCYKRGMSIAALITTSIRFAIACG